MYNPVLFLVDSEQFQQNPICNTNFHGAPLLYSPSPLHCTIPRDNKYPVLALSGFRGRDQWGRGGHVMSLADAGGIDVGEGFVGGRWGLGCAQLEAARNLTLADGD